MAKWQRLQGILFCFCGIAQAFTITTPSKGDTIHTTQQWTIFWDWTDSDPSTLVMYLWKNDSSYSLDLGDNISTSDGSYGIIESVLLTKYIPPGADYQIDVYEEGSVNPFAKSDLFSIANDHLTTTITTGSTTYTAEYVVETSTSGSVIGEVIQFISTVAGGTGITTAAGTTVTSTSVVVDVSETTLSHTTSLSTTAASTISTSVSQAASTIQQQSTATPQKTTISTGVKAGIGVGIGIGIPIIALMILILLKLHKSHKIEQRPLMGRYNDDHRQGIEEKAELPADNIQSDHVLHHDLNSRASEVRGDGALHELPGHGDR